MATRAYVVNATWDDEAEVWVAVSDDVPGLVTEAEDFPRLIKKLQVMIPELLEANGIVMEDRGIDIPIELLAHRFITVSSPIS